jgi:insulysin
MDINIIDTFAVEQVIKEVFSFINFMKATKPQKWIFREMQALRSIHFNALGQEVDLTDPYPTSAEKLSYWLQLFPPKEVVLGSFLLKKWDEGELCRATELLLPETANFMLCSCFEDPYVELGEVEPLYSTQYNSTRNSVQILYTLL